MQAKNLMYSWYIGVTTWFREKTVAQVRTVDWEY